MEYPEVGRIEVEEKAVLPEKSEIPQTGEPVLGVIFEHISSSYGLQIMYELEQQARKAGYHLYPCFPTETGTGDTGNPLSTRYRCEGNVCNAMPWLVL